MRDVEPATRLSEKEQKVLDWAFNLAFAVVAGDYGLPRPMNFAINQLQDAAWELAQERQTTIADSCTEEFKGFLRGCRETTETKKIKELRARLQEE